MNLRSKGQPDNYTYTQMLMPSHIRAHVNMHVCIDPGNWVPVSSPPEAEIPKLLKTKLFARS